MTDIKMSEVFKGEVRCVYTSQEAIQEVLGGDVFHLQDDAYHIANDEDHICAAAQAINQHDKLVEENKRLRAALELAKDMIVANGLSLPNTFEVIDNALNRT